MIFLSSEEVLMHFFRQYVKHASMSSIECVSYVGCRLSTARDRLTIFAVPNVLIPCRMGDLVGWDDGRMSGFLVCGDEATTDDIRRLELGVCNVLSGLDDAAVKQTRLLYMSR